MTRHDARVALLALVLSLLSCGYYAPPIRPEASGSADAAGNEAERRDGETERKVPDAS